LGERPQAVIENTQTQTTYYVTKGQSIGSALVENIEADRVTLIDNGKRFEIQL